jgi:hypothetical protein
LTSPPSNAQYTGRYSSNFIFINRGVTGQDLMSCLTSKNVEFLDRKHE